MPTERGESRNVPRTKDSEHFKEDQKEARFRAIEEPEHRASPGKPGGRSRPGGGATGPCVHENPPTAGLTRLERRGRFQGEMGSPAIGPRLNHRTTVKFVLTSIIALGKRRHRDALQRCLWTFIICGAVVVAGLCRPSHARQVMGVPVPNGVKEAGDHRYRSPLGYETTIRWIERRLRKGGVRVRFKPTIDLPDVVSSHAAAPSGKLRWEGLNVSEYGGSVYIFIIERQ